MEIITFECETCNFKWEKIDPIGFFFDNESNRFEEMGVGMWMCDAMGDKYLTGYVKEAYCSTCDRFVHLYIPDNKSLDKLTKGEIWDIFNKYCNFHPKFYDILFKEDMNSLQTIDKYLCPNCDSTVSFEIKGNKCPVCGENKFHPIKHCLAD